MLFDRDSAKAHWAFFTYTCILSNAQEFYMIADEHSHPPVFIHNTQEPHVLNRWGCCWEKTRTEQEWSEVELYSS